MKSIAISLLSVLCISTSVPAQEKKADPYIWPDDPLVRQKLEKWQDLKFGMIIHWGLYAVPGIIESWALCSEDWIERDSTIGYDDFKKWYWGLKKDFNPVNFNPEQWATAGKKAGMRYLVFTTKHHDGFCMFDTKQTNFKISDGPFKTNPKANVAKHVFDAFRKYDFMIGAYFSKPDWHCEYYWWPKYATADRNNNYDIRRYPWRWNQYLQFTHNQLRELMHNYGSIDILWLDGGWVRPRETVNEEVLSWGARIPEWSQDINMASVATMARKAQPGLLIVDRTVHGPYENYRTPEQRIPNTQLNYPWESCMTLANNWGYVPGDKYKSSTAVIHALIEIVAKGGNLLLGIGPKPDGTFTAEALQRLEEIGAWMQKNGSGIYRTRTVYAYRDSSIYFTQSKDKDVYYALACVKENEPMPPVLKWKNNRPRPGTAMTLLETAETVKWELKGDTTIVYLPTSFLLQNKKPPAIVLSFAPAARRSPSFGN
ncbi:MAG TPA: alpha-L-fucosidase [Chitinophagaceae bacterium]